jgi:hypothetical protein
MPTIYFLISKSSKFTMKFLMQNLVIIFCAIQFCSCQDSNNNKDDSQTVIDKKPISEKVYTVVERGKSNQEFKNQILSNISNEKDKRDLETLLFKLDDRGLSFCEFVQNLLKLDDSCYAVAKKIYPDPDQQNLFSETHDKAIRIAEPAYLKKVRLSRQDADLATVAYAFDTNIKNFCGNY